MIYFDRKKIEDKGRMETVGKINCMKDFEIDSPGTCKDESCQILRAVITNPRTRTEKMRELNLPRPNTRSRKLSSILKTFQIFN